MKRHSSTVSKPTIDPEEWIVSLHDVKRLYISMWKKLFKWAFAGFVASYLYFGNSEVFYKAAGSFKEGVEKSSSENLFKEFIVGMGSQAQPQAASLMKSNQVLKPLVENLGVQILPDHSEWKLARLMRRYKETWKVEKGKPLEDLDSFRFSKVYYDGDDWLYFQIVFSSASEYALFDGKREIAKGKLGEPNSIHGATFTLKSVPKKLKMGYRYPFVVKNWIVAVADLRKRIKIKNDKDNNSILVLSALHRDRYFATEIVNGLMVEYQAYLKREYDAIAKTQLSYLEKKQEQIFDKMDLLFDEHINYLSRNLEENGCTVLEQEAQSLLAPHHQMHAKLLMIDIELKRLNELKREGKAVAIAEEGPFSSGINGLVQRIQDLKQQRDLIELSLDQATEPTLQARRHEIKEIREMRLSVEKLIQEVDHGGEISANDLSPGLSSWARTLTNVGEQEDFAEYLENYARLLSMREKILHERTFHKKEIPEELEGIDLSSARALFMQYNGKLDTSVANLRTFAQVKKEMQNSFFDLSSLSSILQDSLSQKIISDAASLELQLKDEKHYSVKEGERWKGEIALQKKILTDHLDQLSLVEELNVDLMRDKMAGLQSLTLDCINQQISVLHEQIHDAVKERKEALLIEKEVLQKKMEEIRSSLAKIIPEKWRFEKWLGIKTAMVNKVMETVTEVVESKTIANHLHHIESKPLDIALIPSAPEAIHLQRISYLGAFAFPFLIFSFAFISRLIRGFPASFEKLKAIRLPLLGKVSSSCDGKSIETPTGPDLEVIRNMILFSEGAKVVGLIGGQGPDYSYALCENLARRQARSIVIRCDFLAKMRKEDAPGIYQIWTGEIPGLPIRKAKGFDYVTAGGYTPFGTEIIQSSRFEELISQAKENYDWVFLLFKSPLASIESKAALRLCDKAIVTVSGEQIEELTPFVHWGYDEDKCRISFVTKA